jgi:hypothetical protein
MWWGFGNAVAGATLPYHVCHQGSEIPPFFWFRAETVTDFVIGTTCLFVFFYGEASRKRITEQNIQQEEVYNPSC